METYYLALRGFFAMVILTFCAASYCQNSQIQAFSSDNATHAVYGEVTSGTNGFIAAISGNNQGNGGIGVQGYGFRGVWGLQAGASGSGSYAGYFTGDVRVEGSICYNSVVSCSDARLKKGVVQSSLGLKEVLKLRPVQYFYKNEEIKGLNQPTGLQRGFIAQEFEEVVPELVTQTAVVLQDEQSHESKSYKGINYVGLIPVLVKSIQEQNAIIEELKGEVAMLQSLLAK